MIFRRIKLQDRIFSQNCHNKKNCKYFQVRTIEDLITNEPTTEESIFSMNRILR